MKTRVFWVEAFRMALGAIAAHKLRSLLTLVGIIAGVASIIAIMTGISVVQSAMEEELKVLGATVFQVQKFPVRSFGNNDHIDFREIARRKPLTVEHADLIRSRVDGVETVGSELWGFGSVAKYQKEKTNSNLSICGGTPEYPENNTHWVALGRNLSFEDVRVARRVAVIGFNIAEVLFPFTDPIGHEIKVDGRKYVVQGVFEERSSSMGGNFDNYVLMPITTFEKVYGARQRGQLRSVNITVKIEDPKLLEEAIAETTAVLRRARAVDPRDKDDFEIFTSDSQIKAFHEATRNVKVGAFIIGIISLVVAGIGIMNIMLVSVTERTREIGIRKALGARRSSILLQFLIEAVVLCNIGGVIGVAAGFGLGNIVTFFTEFAVNVPMDWAFNGVAFCTVVGLSFGMWPAIRASRLAPIDALRQE